MPTRPWQILLIGEKDEGARLERALMSSLSDQSCVVTTVGVPRVVEHMAQDTYDLLFVDLDALGDGAGTLVNLRAWAPDLPLIAIARSGDETQVIEALQAGVQDCLGGSELEGSTLARAVRYAIERSRYQSRMEEAHSQDVREREIGDLNAMSGPPPLPVSARSLGALPLRQGAPHDFDELVREYAEILDRTLLGRSTKEADFMSGSLNSIADRLGMLGGGPRDAVDLHKAAVTRRLDTASARKNKAYVEEGRLLLVQLMGHLVSFYRSLSWGRGPALRAGSGRRDQGIAEPVATGKQPQ